MTDEEYFDGQCPYTDRPCRKAWDCANCEVEEEERKWMEMLESEEDDDAQCRNDT